MFGDTTVHERCFRLQGDVGGSEIDDRPPGQVVRSGGGPPFYLRRRRILAQWRFARAAPPLS